MQIFQKEIVLSKKSRGFHIITEEILKQIPEIKNIQQGLAHLFIKHTSASLSINENADPIVRKDIESYFNVAVPESADYFEHTFEGPDDMTSHIKASIIGNSVSIPVTDGKFNLGTWQGIYLCEHRNNAGKRSIIVTITGK